MPDRPTDELSTKEAAALIRRLSWPISIRNVRDAIERGSLTAEARKVPGRATVMYFIRRDEAERYAEWRRSQPRRGPKSAKERQAEVSKAARSRQKPDADPWEYRRK